MNAARRKNIASILERLEELKADVELLQEEEQEAFDNMPESLQYSERGERAEEAISNLEEAVSALEEAFSSLEAAAE